MFSKIHTYYSAIPLFAESANFNYYYYYLFIFQWVAECFNLQNSNSGVHRKALIKKHNIHSVRQYCKIFIDKRNLPKTFSIDNNVIYMFKKKKSNEE